LQNKRKYRSIFRYFQRTSSSTSLIIVNTVFTWIPISSWAKSADKGSPLRTGIVDEPSGLIISIRTEGLYTGCRAKEVSFHKLVSKTLITGSSIPIAKNRRKLMSSHLSVKEYNSLIRYPDVNTSSTVFPHQSCFLTLCRKRRKHSYTECSKEMSFQQSKIIFLYGTKFEPKQECSLFNF
jgi:hypothetical protein